MQKREKILSVIALASAAFFIVNQFVCAKKKQQPVATPKVTAKKIQQPKRPAVIKGEKISNEELIRRLQNWQPLVTYETWGRDPFANAVKFEPDSLQDSLALKLTGIVWKGKQAWALIGDRILQPGQRDANFELLRIMSDRVIGRRNGELVTLYLDKNEEPRIHDKRAELPAN